MQFLEKQECTPFKHAAHILRSGLGFAVRTFLITADKGKAPPK
jgi:hypothetical protein